jgi:uncharacterized protein (DUF58 family)
LVRDQEHERHAQHTVRLRTLGAREGDAFEADVRGAASEVIAHLRAGYQVGLRTDSASFEPDEGRSHRTALLTALAVVEPDADEATDQTSKADAA